MITSAAVSGFGLYGLQWVNSDMKTIAQESVPTMLRISEMRSTYLALIPKLYERASTADADKGKALEKQIQEGSQALINQINEYAKNVEDEEKKNDLTQTKLGLIGFITRLQQINALAGMGESQMALDMILRDIGPLHETLSKAFDKLVQRSIDEVNDHARSGESAFVRTLMITVAAAGVGVALIGVMGFVLGRSITKPLGAMQQAITRTANELDFTQTVDIQSSDEVGNTLRAYNELLGRLRNSFS